MKKHRELTGVNLLYEDAACFVVSKPGGLLSVPGRGPEKQDCLATRLRQAFSDCIDQPAVHRLDMATSGLMVFARTAEAHRELSRQFTARSVYKEYEAVLAGKVTGQGGMLRLRFRLDPHNRPWQVYDWQQGKEGITHWHKLEEKEEKGANGAGSLVRVRFTPLTGRTHQLRLHAAHPLGLGAPIVGDSLYGDGKEGDRMYLHATVLNFAHPITGQPLFFHAEAPF